jgi:hypothetical protein
MPRFVLLYHACPAEYERPSHWDLMLEVGDTLHTWALGKLPHQWRLAQVATSAIDPCCPALAAGNVVHAEQLGHHRPVYLEYEGPLSGNRGQVHRIDHGAYEGEPESPRGWQFELIGHAVRGRIVLERDEHEQWFLHCEPCDSSVEQ